MIIDITKEQAKCLTDFLEREFIEDLHKEYDLSNNEYANNIYDAYKIIKGML